MTDIDSDNKQEQEYEKTTISLSDGTTFDFVDNRTREQRLADSKKRVQKWEEDPVECYSALCNELLAPSMQLSIKKLGLRGALLNIHVVTPNFVVGQSEVILQVNKITDEGLLSFENESRIPHDYWNITQHLNTDNIKDYQDAALYLSEPQVTGFTYTIPITPDATWGDDLEVDFKAKLQYALTAQTTLPYVDKEEREKWKEDAIPDKGWLIKEIEYA